MAWTDGGISYEVDPRHVQLMIKELRLTDGKDVVTPGTHEEGKTSEDKDEPLEPLKEIADRALVARANYLFPERPDFPYAAQELAKSMAKPTVGDWARLKRMTSYPIGRPRVQIIFPWQDVKTEVISYTDGDWAGDKVTRTSTSG